MMVLHLCVHIPKRLPWAIVMMESPTTHPPRPEGVYEREWITELVPIAVVVFVVIVADMLRPTSAIMEVCGQ